MEHSLRFPCLQRIQEKVGKVRTHNQPSPGEGDLLIGTCGWQMILGDLFITFSILKGFSYAAENLIHDREDTVRESSVSVGLYPLTLLSPHQGATFA